MAFVGALTSKECNRWVSSSYPSHAVFTIDNPWNGRLRLNPSREIKRSGPSRTYLSLNWPIPSPFQTGGKQNLSILVGKDKESAHKKRGLACSGA